MDALRSQMKILTQSIMLKTANKENYKNWAKHFHLPQNILRSQALKYFNQYEQLHRNM